MGEIIYLNTIKPEVTANAGTRFRRPVVGNIKIKKDPFVDDVPVKSKHAAEPIKDIEDINRIINYFLSTGQYRNNLIFVTGINFGLRCGDLLQLKVGHILNPDLSFREEVRIEEKKTKKVRTCYMNDAIMDAAEVYLSSLEKEINLNDYLFTSLSNNRNSDYYESYSYKEESASIGVKAVERMLKKVINDELGIKAHAGTHLLRKTFGYHVFMNAPKNTTALEFLQKVFGHSSQAITLRYIGITDEEIKNTCQKLNLGSTAMSIGKEIYYASGLDSAI